MYIKISCKGESDKLDFKESTSLYRVLNLKGKTSLFVVNKLFVFSSALKQNMIFSVFSAAY